MGIYQYYNFDYGNNFGLNELGDYFAGSVASTWSLAGLFFIYVAFLGQKQQLLNQQLELLYNRIEIKNTQFELKGQKEQLRLQNETQKLQQFESTFFQLINNFEDVKKKTITKSLHYVNSFEQFYKSFTGNVARQKLDVKDIKEINEFYLHHYNKNFKILAQYFNNLHYLIVFVLTADINKNKKTYIDLIRLKMSKFETLLLFYHSLTEIGNENFKSFIEDYSFFENCDFDKLISKDHVKQFKKSTFG